MSEKMLDCILWGISVLTICGSILNIKKIAWCFWIWSFCNVCWLIVDVTGKVYSRAVLDLINLSTSIWGIIEWHKNSSNKKKENDTNDDSLHNDNNKNVETV